MWVVFVLEKGITLHEISMSYEIIEVRGLGGGTVDQQEKNRMGCQFLGHLGM